MTTVSQPLFNIWSMSGMSWRMRFDRSENKQSRGSRPLNRSGRRAKNSFNAKSWNGKQKQSGVLPRLVESVPVSPLHLGCFRSTGRNLQHRP